MTPTQISAVLAHAAKIQGAFEALQNALAEAQADAEGPSAVRAEARIFLAGIEAYADDTPWLLSLSTPADVIASFE